MTVLTVCGKADSRVIVYPSLFMFRGYGKTMVASDDAAYKRLYHGYGDIGEVSGVSVYVNTALNLEVLQQQVYAIQPDYLFYVTNGHVPDFTTHLLVLTGHDRTFDAGNAQSADQLAEDAEINPAEADIITAPPHITKDRVKELIVSTQPVKSKTTLSVNLKDSLMTYAALCEEYKQLRKHESRDFIGVLMNLYKDFVLPDVSKVPGIFGFKK